MQKRVERSGADAIPMMLKLLYHRQPKDRLVSGMHKHVNAYKTRKKFPLMYWHG